MSSEPESPPADDRPGPSSRARGYAVLGGALAGALLFTALCLAVGDYAADQLGLGLNTSSAEEVTPEGRVSGQFGQVSDLRVRLQVLRAEGRQVALWLGASQLHAINRRVEADHLAVFHADVRARARGASRRYLQVSAPNANLQELLRVYQAFRAEPRCLPETLVLALTYDDLGEPGVREVAAQLGVASQAEPEQGEDAAAEPAGPERAASQSEPAVAPVKRSATAGTPQEHLETRLVAGLETVWPGYSERGSLRSWSIVSWKEPLTGLLFALRGRPGQTPAPNTMATNLEALNELIRLTRADGVRLLIYKPPHRPGEVPFYHPRQDYDDFFAQLEARCARDGVHYLDLELLVPAELWGLTNNYLPDVFHFRGEGHTLLGEAIDRWFEEAAQ